MVGAFRRTVTMRQREKEWCARDENRRNQKRY